MEPVQAVPSTQGATTERGLMIDLLDRRFSPRGIRERQRRRHVVRVGWLVLVNLLSGLKRAVDIAAALFLLTISSFPFLLLFLYARSRGGGISRSVRLGRWACCFNLYTLDFGRANSNRWLNQTRLIHLPTLWNVLKGDLSIVGPRPVAPDTNPEECLAWRRYLIRPGLLCLWWIRRRANIAYSTEFQVDAEYVDTYSFRGDIGIALRAIPAALYGDGVNIAPDIVNLAGIAVNNLTMDEAIDYIVRSGRQMPSQICFANADCVNIASRNTGYMDVLHSAAIVLADGIGMKLAGRILNTNIRQNVNGTDLFPRLCERLEHTGQGIFLLGGAPGVAESVAKWVHDHYPAADIRGTHHGFFDRADEPGVIDTIRESRAHVLLVAFGAPKQDLWIRQNLHDTGVKVAMGVGGLFDFYSGHIPRAPQWLREIGGEWFFRFIQEPRRMWRRYFVGNVVFLYRVFQYRARARKQQETALREK
jgi:N-acetylglucosaminyldiphosphoundecaprenol N-acetyl-beta-D-mannosaminyltransferase